MLFSRRVLLRSRTIFASGPTAPRTPALRQSLNRIARRGYASEGHGSHSSSGSDWPWAIGATVVTVPCGGYLWVNGAKRDAGHGHGEHGEHEEHGEEGEHEGSEEQADQEEAGEQQEESEGASKEESKDASREEQPKGSEAESKPDDSSSDEEDGKDTPDTSDDESDDNKDQTSQQSDQTEGEGANSEEKPRWGKKNKGPLDAGQKVPTHAKHKGSPHDDTSKSKKPEGIHDTAKVLQPIDPFRPASNKKSDD
ncbi:hypothetical protein MMC10_010248 [Thelotrema lepadinum]|nr:hypothetical protein [Thelotrema lepadinum]